MNPERERILKMVAEGKITVPEAEQLLDALAIPAAPPAAAAVPAADAGPAKTPSFLYVKVISKNDDNVDVRIPLKLLRAGIKLTALIPPHAMHHLDSAMEDKGIPFDFKNLKPENIGDLIDGLAEMAIDITTKDGDLVKIYCA